MVSFNRAEFLRFRALLQVPKTDKERLELIWQDYRASVEARNNQEPVVGKSEKDTRAAQNLKEKGNRYYAQKDFREALLSYNEALCKAPNGSPLIPLIYANRSAVYFQAGIYLQALENIDLALEHGYPVEKRDKLEERQTRCLNLMAQLPDAKVYIQPNPALKPFLSHPPHPKYPFLSKAVDIRMDANRGPILVSQEKLKVGDIFFKEPIFLKAIDPRESWSQYGMCAHCMESNFLSLIPCTECSVALFCKDCLSKAQDVHRFECPILKHMYSMNETMPPGWRNTMSLIVRTIIYVIRLFDLEDLDLDIFDLQTKKEKLLGGDYNNDIERQIIKWIFVRSEEVTLDEWAIFGTIANMYMDTIMLSPPLKALISTPKMKTAILNVLFHLHIQTLAEVDDEDRSYFTYQPIKMYFSMADMDAEINAQTNLKRDNFIYCIRPLRKGKEIKFRLNLAIMKPAGRMTEMILSLVYNLRMGNPGPLIDHFRSILCPEFQQMDKNIQNFDAAAEMLKMFTLFKQDIKKCLKEKERIIRLLTENDDKFPCFDIAVVLWHLASLIDYLQTDFEFIAKSSMMPNVSTMMNIKAASKGYKI